MTMSCRHCFGRHEFEASPASSAECFRAPASYLERLVYGSTHEEADSSPLHMKRVLEWVETAASGDNDIATPMPGIVVWWVPIERVDHCTFHVQSKPCVRRCHGCRRMSVISYTYYLLLSRQEDGIPADKILSLSAYYTRMCMGAEMWMQMIALHSKGQPVAALAIDEHSELQAAAPCISVSPE